MILPSLMLSNESGGPAPKSANGIQGLVVNLVESAISCHGAVLRPVQASNLPRGASQWQSLILSIFAGTAVMLPIAENLSLPDTGIELSFHG